MLIRIPHLFSINPVNFLYQPPCLFFPLWQADNTCLFLLLKISPPLLYALCPGFFFDTSLPSPKALCLLSLRLCLFVWLTPVITRLCLVFCFHCVVSLGLCSESMYVSLCWWRQCSDSIPFGRLLKQNRNLIHISAGIKILFSNIS